MKSRSLRAGVSATIAVLAALLLAATVGAGSASAHPFGKNGYVYACYKVKGKNRGALRVVRHARKCKRMRGWRRMSWSALGFSGPAGARGSQGSTGQSGPAGERGPQGEAGTQGAAGEIEKSLIETVQTQSLQIDELTNEVSSLTGSVTSLVSELTDQELELASLTGQVSSLTSELVNLEGTVEGACTQISEVTDQSDELTEAVAGLSLNGTLEALGGLLEVPALPATLGTFECS